MDIAIVTGASSALGLAISNRLIQLGFRVYGLGGDYKECPLKNVNFKPMSCDLSDPEALERVAGSILEKEKGVCLLVNNAKFFGTHSFAEMTHREMEAILRINLLCPLVLTRFLAESLTSLQGHVINLGASTVETSRGGAVGAAASGGLKWMGEVLFQDLRDHGVKVCHIAPEPNRSRDVRLSARKGRISATLDPEAVAQAVEQILQSPYGNIVTELVLRPLRTSEPDIDPVVQLPYPKPKPIPYTVPREVIEAEEQLEEEAFQAAREKKRARRRSRSSNRKEQATEESANTTPEPTESSYKQSDTAQTAHAAQAPTEKKSASSPKEGRQEQTAPAKEADAAPVKSGSGRRRRRRKPKPPLSQVGFHAVAEPAEPYKAGSGEKNPARSTSEANKTSEQVAQKEKAEPREADKPVVGSDSTQTDVVKADESPKPATRKKAAKTTAKKVTRKVAKKATTKAAKKAATKKTTVAKKAVARKAVKKAAKKAAKKATKKAARKTAKDEESS
jgi:hypothetical protein